MVGSPVPANRPGDISRQIKDLWAELRKLNAKLTPSSSPVTAAFFGSPLSGAYDATQPVQQVTFRVTTTADASGIVSVPLGDSMSAVLVAHPSELLTTSTSTPIKLYVRADLAAADQVQLQARSVVDGSVAASATVDALVTVTYQP